MNALSCHAVVSDTLTVKDCEQLLKHIEHDLLHLNIQHMTIQLETVNHDHDETTLCTGVHHHYYKSCPIIQLMGQLLIT